MSTLDKKGYEIVREDRGTTTRVLGPKPMTERDAMSVAITWARAIRSATGWSIVKLSTQRYGLFKAGESKPRTTITVWETTQLGTYSDLYKEIESESN